MKHDIHSRVNAELGRITWTAHDQYSVLHRISEENREPIKKKISFRTILVVAILLIGATAAVAEMLGFNIFELFGKTHIRYSAIAPYTMLEQTSEVLAETEKLGTTVASVKNAYYDGQSLLVGYALQNNNYMEEFTPDDALLTKMTKSEEIPFLAITAEADAALACMWNQAVSDGLPIGISICRIYPSDHTFTDDGIDIPPYTENTQKGDDGAEYTIREYESPLDPALQNLDHLNLNIPLKQSVSYYYFDGTIVYTCHEQRNLEPMKATVWNTDGSSNVFTGSSQYNDLDYEVSVHVSAVYAELEISFDAESLPQLPDSDHWYEFHLTDENGAALRISEYCAEPGLMRVVYEGTGKVPSELTLRIYIGYEGDFDEGKAIREARAVALKLQQ